MEQLCGHGSWHRCWSPGLLESFCRRVPAEGSVALGSEELFDNPSSPLFTRCLLTLPHVDYARGTLFS